MKSASRACQTAGSSLIENTNTDDVECTEIRQAYVFFSTGKKRKMHE